MASLPELGLAHVGVAVADLQAALAFYREVLGAIPGEPEHADGATIIPVPVGDTVIELLSSREPGTPIARYLERHGPGIHHLCYRVPDLEAALAACRKAGYRPIDDAPRRGAGGRRIAFLHPKATSGILIELTE